MIAQFGLGGNRTGFKNSFECYQFLRDQVII